MLQIKSYLSKIYDIKSVLLIGRTKEFKELALWLLSKKGIEKIYYCSQEEKFGSKLPNSLSAAVPQTMLAVCRGYNDLCSDWVPASNVWDGCEADTWRMPRGSFAPQFKCTASLIPCQLAAGRLTEHCTLEHVLHSGKQVDTQIDAVIFDRGCRKEAMEIWKIAPRIFIGRLDKEEEYFDLWEQYRQVSDFIYLEREKTISPEESQRPSRQSPNIRAGTSTWLVARGNKKDVNSCEILEWQRGEEDIELSVILPVYNVEAYLPACIESLLKWKAPYVEYLFVNDGSVDGSADVIRKYREQDRRIHLIDKENGGCASARNRGIEEAKGRYLGFVDPDDFIDESMFYKLFRRMILGNYDLAYCGYKEYYEQPGKTKEVLNDCLKEPYYSGTYRQDKVQKLTVNTRVAIWRCIYKKDVMENNQIRFHEDLKRFDDLPFRMEYIFAAKSAVCVPEYLYYYRLGRKGQDVACSDEGFFVHFSIFEHLDKYVERYKDKAKTDLLQVIKIQTHGFALSKMKGKIKWGYWHRARQDLNKNMGYFRTLCLILMYTGKGNLGWYTGMKLWPFKGN